jgi:hypothetical protein
MRGKENNYLHLAAECAHHGLRETLDGQGRRRWALTCGHCGKEADVFRSDVRHAQQILGHFTRAGWLLARRTSPYCSKECSKAEKTMSSPNNTKPPAASVPAIGPNPIIMRRVITLLNDQFDMQTRLYRESYSDERVAKEAETSPDYVITLRRSAYGELAEDPMISRARDDIVALKALLEQEIVKLRGTFDAQIKELDYKLARIIGHHKAAG